MMRSILPACMLAALLAVGADGGVSAAGAPHNPLHLGLDVHSARVVADNTVPDPNTLLAQATQALRAAGSFHFVADSNVELGALGAVTVHEVGDVDLKHQTARGQDKGSITAAGKTKSFNEHTIQVKTKLWYKSKSTKNKWKKGSGTGGSTFDFKNFSLEVNSSSTGLNSSQITLTTVGLEQLNGASVWHVHGDFTITTDTSTNTQIPGTLDYYITQQGTLPVLLKLNFDDATDGVVLNVQEAFSNFGEVLNTKAPKVGSTKP